MKLRAALPRTRGKPRPYAGNNANFAVPHAPHAAHVPHAPHVSGGNAIEGRCALKRDIPRFGAFYQRGKPPVRKFRGGFVTCDRAAEGFDNLAGAAVPRQLQHQLPRQLQRPHA